MSAKTTLVTFVLDETGSMQSIKDDTIGGFNSYLDSLRDETHGKVEFTLVKFDSNKIEKVYVGAPIASVEPLNGHTYRPGAATPLIDACYKSIKATEEAVAKREDSPSVLCVLQTDGQENASTEYSFKDLAGLIKEKENAGWVFVFLGAGIDAYDIGVDKLGLSVSNTMSYGRENSRAAFAAMASNTTAYRSTGMAASMAFSTGQKSAAGDAYVSKQADGRPKADASARPTRKAVDDLTFA